MPRILVVDDVADTARLLGFTLQAHGYDVSTASSGRQAIELAAAEHPDVILLDVMMPEMDGIEVCKRIRANPEICATPIILVTAKDHDEDFIAGLDAGADDYVTKPFVSKVLAARVRAALRTGKSHREIAQVNEQLRIEIDDRKRAEVALRQNENKLKQQQDFLALVLDNVQSGIVACDANGILTLFNRASRDFHGLPEEAITPQDWAEHYNLFLPDGKTRMKTEDIPLFRAFLGERFRDIEMMIVPPARRARTLRASGGPLIDEDGELKGAVVAIEDITDRRHAEEALQKKDDELRQAQKMEAVGLLAGGIAHEFNNLLQVIQGYTTFAIDGLGREEQRYADLQQVLEATERAATLTRQLLGFSRRRMLQPTNVDVNALVTDLVKMMQPLLRADLELKTVLGSDAGTVYADPGELHQVLLNLCINARDAMPSGGTLVLRTESAMLSPLCQENGFSPRPGRYVKFEVADTGRGMSTEIREHIFEPFFTTKGPGKGTGLGLAMVYGIVQQHGGTIRVVSAPGTGTSFHVYLPAGDDVQAAVDREKPPVPPRGTETLLFAEDDPLVQQFVTRILQEAGYTVLAAIDGEEAVRLFENNKDEISLAVLDAIMPKLTGQQVYRRIRESRPDARVVFCTGYDPETAGSIAFADEDVRVIEKPFDEGTLLRTVREVLDEALHAAGACTTAITQCV